MKSLIPHLTVLFTSLLSPAYAVDIYMSPNGSDAEDGSISKPLASLRAAQAKAQIYLGKEAVNVHFQDGIYYLPETAIFKPSDSGTKGFPVTYKAVNEGEAVLSGGSLLKLNWSEYRDEIYQAETPAGLVIDQLFIDGENQRMARYPNHDLAKKTVPYQGCSADAFSKERAKLWANPEGGYIHAIHRSSWGGYHYLITGKDGQGEVTYEGGWQNNRQMGMHKDYRMVENIFEELDAEGEWYHDQKNNILYYQPKSGNLLHNSKVEVVRLAHLVEFQGSAEAPVKHVTFDGFTVRHASRTFMETKEPMVRSDWAIYRGGAFMLTGTKNIQILNMEFDQVGGNAIFVNNYNQHTLIKGCHIHDTGASGVCFVGDPNAVRDPLFEYSEKNDLATIDRTPGPKTNNYPVFGIVADCLIHGIGRVERQPAGVQIEMAAEITVRDTSVYDCARAGINIGDGAWGGHMIERVDVFDTVLETHDHGSFNSWGRDRYWRSDHLTTSQAAVDKEPDLPFLDAIKTTTIRDSRWRCDHGWDIDLDDGSSNYDIYNNLMLGKGLKLREGYRRHAWNNVIPFGSLHPHVWFQRSKDQVYSNIFSNAHRAARMATLYVDETIVDKNFFNTTNKNVLSVSKRLGWDVNSILGDPMFVDPANGNFSVKADSPALKIGFKNFPMDQFGVKKPSLKAMAKTPNILKTEVTKVAKSKAAVEVKSLVWNGFTLQELKGEEFSAYGVTQKNGGVAIIKAENAFHSTSESLLTGDLIQSINGAPTPELKSFKKVIKINAGKVMQLGIIRNQQPLQITFKVTQ